jgi:pilus assembly protein Flp/PilA
MKKREDGMNKFLLNAQRVLGDLHREESGQDLIEYALIAALIALAATVGMGTVAKAINTAFSSIGTKLTTYAS